MFYSVCSLLSPQSHHYTIEKIEEKIRRILLRLFMTMFAVFCTLLCAGESRVCWGFTVTLEKEFFIDAFQLAFFLCLNSHRSINFANIWFWHSKNKINFFGVFKAGFKEIVWKNWEKGVETLGGFLKFVMF